MTPGAAARGLFRRLGGPRLLRPARLRVAVERLRGALWLWPLLLAVLAAAAAEVLVRLDRRLEAAGTRPGWVFGGDASAARSVLSTIATATITVLGVTLTITLAVLTLSANAYSPRVIRRFMRDRPLQLTLASLLAVIVFTLVGLRLVRAGEVPGITVTFAVAMTFAVLGLLVWFFHHLASEIRVEAIIGAIHDETLAAIDATPPGSGGAAASGVPGDVVDLVLAPRAGRVVVVDAERLADVARATGGTLVVDLRTGAFTAAGEVIVRQHAGRRPSEEERSSIRAAVVLGRHRTWPSASASWSTSPSARCPRGSTTPRQPRTPSGTPPISCDASRTAVSETGRSPATGGSSSAAPVAPGRISSRCPSARSGGRPRIDPTPRR
jgi:uncharacterized membrane protein